MLVGQLPNHRAKLQLANFLTDLKAPFFCDVTSGLSFAIASRIVDPENSWQMQGLLDYQPDLVIQFGLNPLSKYWHLFIGRCQPQALWFFSQAEGSLNTTSVSALQIKVTDFSFVAGLQLADPGVDLSSSEFLNWARSKVDPIMVSWAGVARTVLEHSETPLFLANSSSVRAFDSWIFEKFANRPVITQRGVSGIEGHIASGIGLSLALAQRITVVIGDIALLHDLNSLFLLANAQHPCRIICVNNYGGGHLRQIANREVS